MKKAFLFQLIVLFLVGCTPQNGEKKEGFEAEKKKIISNLIKKYNISYTWNKLEYEYSINYKQVIESPCQLIDDFDIIDIYSKNDVEYVSLRVSYYPSFYFDFPITKEQEGKLIKYRNKLLLLVSISEIEKIKIRIIGEIDDKEAYVELDGTNDFMGKGKIIDIFLLTN